MIIHSDSLNAAFEQERIVAPQTASPNEESIERALRPKAFGEYVGQDRVREQLEIFISAAKQRSETLDHVLLFGPPGLGKTTQLGRESRRESVCPHVSLSVLPPPLKTKSNLTTI